MKKITLIASITLFCLELYSQSTIHDGIYSYGDDWKKEKTGTFYLHSNSDSTSLFYLEIENGPPGFHVGAMIGEMTFMDNYKAYFEVIIDSTYGNCLLHFEFNDDVLIISTDENKNFCGYGYGVYSDGKFKRRSYISPDFFVDGIDGKGVKYYFKSLERKTWGNW